MKKRTKPGVYLVSGFLTLILIGSFILNLPLSKTPDSQATYFDCLFVSVSATCVTGLTTVDIATNFSVFGRIVVLFLIQLGGLGYATVALFILTVLGKKLSLSDLTLVQEAINFDMGNGIVDLVICVLKYAISIEALGAVLLYFPYHNIYPSFWKALGMGIFHSVSAFNNAGFDLNGNLSSLEIFHGNIYVYCVICALIILGGLGFFVMKDILHKRNWAKLTLQSKLVLSSSLFLIVVGTVLLYLDNLNLADSFFFSVSARTAGFSTMSLEKLTESNKLVMIVLMFIGASPGSTGGGIKTTTLAVIYISTVTVVTGRKPYIFKRRIPQISINKALTVFFLAILYIFVATLAILIIENDADHISVLFEVVSALATVGLSVNLTTSLAFASRIIIMLAMFVGRLGPLTIASSFSTSLNEHVDYIEEHVIIG